MTVAVKCIESSIYNDIPLYTLQLRYPRLIHGELLTHRVFSRNSSSSRAKPYNRWVYEILTNIALPSKIHRNKAGMQGGEELEKEEVEKTIRNMANAVISYTDEISYVHKQVVNRYLEPFTHIDTIVTSTEWKNFFDQRDNENADPTLQELALKIKRCLHEETPRKIDKDHWHLPYITSEERVQYSKYDLRLISAARCARVSYSNHNGTSPDIKKDIELADLLLLKGHMSPFEHQAMPARIPWSFTHMDFEPGITHVDYEGWYWSNNFRGWIQSRALLDRRIEPEE